MRVVGFSQPIQLLIHIIAGNPRAIGTYLIQRAFKDMERLQIQLPDRDLAYLKEGTDDFDDYVDAVGWAQDFARINREIMMENAVEALREKMPISFEVDQTAVNRHHIYIS